MIDTIVHGDCMDVMDNMEPGTVDVILTSPFYNTNTKAGKTRTLQNTTVKDGQYQYVRYDEFIDSMSDEEYREFTTNLFNSFDLVLKDNGVVLYNISYGSEGGGCPHQYY